MSDRHQSIGDVHEAWLARGRELNRVYDTLFPAIGADTVGDPIADLRGLIAQRDDALALLRRMREGEGYPMWNAEIDRVLGRA